MITVLPGGGAFEISLLQAFAATCEEVDVNNPKLEPAVNGTALEAKQL